MKKQEYDVIEKVYCTTRIPSNEVNDSINIGWWSKTHHETDKFEIKDDTFVHEIAFDGIKPLTIKSITRGRKSIFKHEMFTAKYKQR